MDARLFTTPDRIIEASAVFSREGFERSFEEVLRDAVDSQREPVSAFRGRERPMRAMRAACRAADAVTN